ncbi:hypothetical protein [Deinococcus altitudinis]|uniref:hypothetical protein n=1 Tax=Deinococcus altitudinis TaxID=468914 RepID=UPI003891E7EA
MTQTMTVVGSDRAPTEQDALLLTRTQALLQAEPHFTALNTPTLSRAEVNAELTETTAGYLYLRYDVVGALPQEFWTHWGTHDRVAWKSGQITVKKTDS